MMRSSLALSLLLCFFASQAKAWPVANEKSISWYDLAFAEVVYLTEAVTLDSNLTIPVDSKFKLLSVSSGGDFVPVTFFDFEIRNCVFPEATSEMLMIRPKQTPTSANGEVGFTLKKNCQVEIIVESKEIQLPSIFTDSSN